MDSPFRLFVYGVIAVALVAIVITVYYNIFESPSLSEEMQNALDIANSVEYTGKYYYFGAKSLSENTIISTSFFDTRNMSVALECVSPNDCCPRGEICNKKIEWDYDYVRIKNNMVTDMSIRCVRYEGTPVCRFYITGMPAQAKINSVELLEQDEKDAAVRIEVENVGEQKMTFAELNLTLYKKIKNDWAETEKLFETRELESLDKGREFRFLWDLQLETGGKYKAEFKFESLNGGFDTESIEIDVNALGNGCEIDRVNIDNVAMIDSNKFREIHYCVGCESSFECLSKWNEEYPEFDYELLTKDSVYCIKDTLDETCG